MSTNFGSNLIRAFEAGRRVKMEREEKEREAEERKLRLALLKQQSDKLKHEQAVSDFKEKWNFKSGQPAEKLPAVDYGSQESTIPGGVPVRARLEELALPNQPMAVPEELGGGVATPQTAEDILRRQLMTLAQQEQIKHQYAAPSATPPFASSPLGIFDRRSGQVTTPAPAPDKAGQIPGRDIPYPPDVEAQRRRMAQGGQSKLLTPAEEAQRIRLINAGKAASGGAKSIPAGIKKDLANIDATTQLLTGLEAKATLNPNWTGGLLSGGQNAMARYKEKRGTITREEALFRKEVVNDLVNRIHELSGAAVSPTEAERLLQAVPNLDMSNVEFKAAVRAVVNDLTRVKDKLMIQFGPDSQQPTAPVVVIEQPNGEFVQEGQ